MSAQLSLWACDATQVQGGSPIVLTIRESRRARQLILQALPPRTVEIVVPRGMRPEAVHHFVRDHRSWIDRAGAEMLEAYPEADLRPATIELKALAERLSVRYLEAPGRTCYRQSGDELSLYCASAQDDSLRLLRRWLLAEGRRVLEPWLRREAERTGLAPSTVQVRLQKTRWGSCSARGRVSVNAALLLVPPELVRYLFVHELCHLKQLSHSRRFWETVARFEPGYRELDRRLAASWRKLPAWAFALSQVR